MTDVEAEAAPVLRLTDAAMAKVLELRDAEASPTELALWVQVSGASGSTYTYDMFFEAASDAKPEDWRHDRDGLVVIVAADSVEKMCGSVLDLSRDLMAGGMVISNPNLPPSLSPAMGGAAVDLTGDVAQRVVAVIDQQINPSIAAHGGHAEAVAVADAAAYLRLSGGCAGCGMASVTLSQGIEVAIREAVPEITRVIDVTDHAAGTNPFYEPSKK